MNIFRKLAPPAAWRIPVIILSGILAGLAVYIFWISRAPSYLSDDPSTCMNCHIMAPQYATWSHSSHREKTNCNDCHVPHNNVLNKYYFKAKDGLRHAYMFTLRLEPQSIFIHEEGKEVVHHNCLRCHDELVHDSRLLDMTTTYRDSFNERKCWDCHRETPHGRVHSLSSVPFARVPGPESPVPLWLNTLMNK